ncbi:hypothetical protein OH76DRAFT_555938 [Lentinus brumalis]|uniref:Uncharacterized protein n=1 Tax=Lentinus brumalis TaxID=2498619 RepID=A0A371D984_9APHY|nr:hypothetical protein OH76DRAFT_555938 [Polyporus brumalis]
MSPSNNKDLRVIVNSHRPAAGETSPRVCGHRSWRLESTPAIAACYPRQLLDNDSTTLPSSRNSKGRSTGWVRTASSRLIPTVCAGSSYRSASNSAPLSGRSLAIRCVISPPGYAPATLTRGHGCQNVELVGSRSETWASFPYTGSHPRCAHRTASTC